MIVKGSCQLGRANETLSASVRLVMTRLASGELLALACSGRARHALARYRQRWTIETIESSRCSGSKHFDAAGECLRAMLS